MYLPLSEDLLYELAYLNFTEAFEVSGCIAGPSAHLPVPLAVLALLTDPVDGVEVIVGPHTRDGLL